MTRPKLRRGRDGMLRIQVPPPYPVIVDPDSIDPEAVVLSAEEADALYQSGRLVRPWSVSTIGRPYFPNARPVDPAKIVRGRNGIAVSKVPKPLTGRPRGRPPGRLIDLSPDSDHRRMLDDIWTQLVGRGRVTLAKLAAEWPVTGPDATPGVSESTMRAAFDRANRLSAGEYCRSGRYVERTNR